MVGESGVVDFRYLFVSLYFRACSIRLFRRVRSDALFFAHRMYGLLGVCNQCNGRVGDETVCCDTAAGGVGVENISVEIKKRNIVTNLKN